VHRPPRTTRRLHVQRRRPAPPAALLRTGCGTVCVPAYRNCCDEGWVSDEQVVVRMFCHAEQCRRVSGSFHVNVEHGLRVIMLAVSVWQTFLHSSWWFS